MTRLRVGFAVSFIMQSPLPLAALPLVLAKLADGGDRRYEKHTGWVGEPESGSNRRDDECEACYLLCIHAKDARKPTRAIVLHSQVIS